MEDRCCYSVFIIVYHNTQVREENLETRGDVAQVEAIYNTDSLQSVCGRNQFQKFSLSKCSAFHICVCSKLNDNNNLRFWNVSEDECLCQSVHYIIITTTIVTQLPSPPTNLNITTKPQIWSKNKKITVIKSLCIYMNRHIQMVIAISRAPVRVNVFHLI